jgi:uncharacterized membrane protein
MFPLSIFLTPLSIFLSVSTATGVLVHDTRVDKATMAALSTPAPVASGQADSKMVSFSGDAHTHTERHSLSQAVRDLKADNPRIHPRSQADKKYLSQKNLGLGHDPFDSYALPLA